MNTKQLFVNRKLFTRKPVDELTAILRNTDGVHQIGLYDLDGTMHRGLCPSRLKGMTNADLAIYLGWNIDLQYLPQFVREGRDIYRYERTNISEKKDNEREIHISFLVDEFRNSLLALPENIVRKGIAFLPRLRYKLAKEVLGLIKAEGALISCGFQPVVEAYGDSLGITKRFGNPLFPGDARQHGNIHYYGDKKRVAKSISAQRYIVIGDTFDDTGLVSAAKEVNNDSVVIALHGRCSHLEDVADIIAPSWEDLQTLFNHN